MIKERKATINDYVDFSELLLLSAPYFPTLFGGKIKIILQDLFRHSSNLFSFKHSHIAEIDGKIAGMILGYDGKTKKRENLKTGLLFFKEMGIGMIFKLKSFLKLNATVGSLNIDEYYISNVAVYPRYRGKGIGKKLMSIAEEEAKMADKKRMVLDVEKDNTVAIGLYKKLGYKIIKEFSITLQNNKNLYFYRMIKEVK